MEHNLEDPVIRLLVAGSRRQRLDDGTFVNRASVLGLDGSLLWEQDKRIPFRLERDEDPALFAKSSADFAEEPSYLGRRIAAHQTLLGVVMTPICIDYFKDPTWTALSGHLYLVPAMTGSLGRFRNKAEQLGARNGAVTLVCNASGGKDPCLPYIPRKSGVECENVDHRLFTLTLDYVVTFEKRLFT